MSSPSNPDLVIAAWLDEEAREGAPERLIDATRRELERTNQRRAVWPAWRLSPMNMRFAVAAAVVVIAVVAGFLILPRPSGPGTAPTSTPVPTSTPAPTPVSTPQPLGDAQLEAGTVEAFTGPNGSIKLTFAVPDGWRGFGGSCVIPVTGTTAPDGMGICFGQVTAGLYSDPCHGSDGPADISTGPTVDDLATALSQQTEYDSTTPTDVTLGGFSGKRMDLLLPSDVASCDLGSFTPWEGSIYAQGPDNRWHLWILDVEGVRVIVTSTDFAGTSDEDRAEQQAIIDSIEITP